MSPDDLLVALRRTPFEPFRLVTTDGASYDIRHPDMVFVARRTVIVGVPRENVFEPPFDRYHIVALLHVIRLENLPLPSGQNGG